MSEAMAYIARTPGKPGACGYINQKRFADPGAQALLLRWLLGGKSVVLVPLAQAMQEYALQSRENRQKKLQQSEPLNIPNLLGMER